MIDIDFGINIVEIVTKGLYTNSLDALREYVQNSCDAIDDAVKAGILAQNDGTVTIDIDESARKITIEDNGMGLSTRYFERTMGSIGNSDKSLKTDRGFRGIGRLGGLAYCDVLIFSSKVAGEKKVSRLIFNAKGLREVFWHERKRSAESVLIQNMHSDTFDADADTPEHFFRVEMIDIVDTNEDLLDVAKVRDYLSFVAPVTYDSQFTFQTEIYKHAEALNFKITEYRIEVNGEPVVKNYKTNVRTKSGDDEIFSVEFRDIYDEGGNLIAWLWFGLSTFKGVLSEAHDSESYKMRGLRLRLGNIQIGNAEVLKSLFNESRGWKYFIGEIHAVGKKLRPNSKRDDFEEDKAYNDLKAALSECLKELNDIYRAAAGVRTEQNKINAPAKAKAEFDKRSPQYQKTHQAEYDAAILMLKKAAAKAKETIAKKREEYEAAPDSAQSKVVRRILENQPTVQPVDNAEDTDDDNTNTPPPKQDFPPSDWPKKLRRLYHTIEAVIIDNPKLAGDKLLDKIKEELAK